MMSEHKYQQKRENITGDLFLVIFPKYIYSIYKSIHITIHNIYMNKGAP